MRIVCFLFTLMLAFPAFAQDEKKEEAEQSKPETPITKWMAAESAVVAELDTQGKETYFILRNKFGLIRAIRIVKRDVGNAVQECGQANPDMQDTMTKRYEAWTNAVDPILKTADAYLKQEIKHQEIVDGDVMDEMLELNDEAYEFQENAIEKRVVTTADACTQLLQSMDRTEEDMLNLMQQVLLPESVIRQHSQN